MTTNNKDKRFVVRQIVSSDGHKFEVFDTRTEFSKGSYDTLKIATEYAKHLNENYIKD